jgi:hypothetical protein
MVISSRRGRAERLREAIDEFRADQKDYLDEWALNLLLRLADSPAAAKAFEELRPKDRRAEAGILTVCVKAEQLSRTFSSRLKRAKELLARLKRLEKDVASLYRYVDEVAKHTPAPTNLLSTPIRDRPADIAAMICGLDLIARRIDAHRRVEKNDILQLGATRKTQIKQAGELAALGYLAEGVRRVTGRAHLMKVADLAEVILRSPVIWYRVGYAARRRERLAAR